MCCTEHRHYYVGLGCVRWRWGVAGGSGYVRGGGGTWEVEVGVEEMGEGKYEDLTMQIKP